MWVPVTFYDYHANETNSNFQPTGGVGDMGAWAYDDPPVRRGMVLTNLDADRKPVLNTSPTSLRPEHNRLNQWFRPSGMTGSQMFTVTNDFCGVWSNLVSRPDRPNEWIVSGRNETDSMVDIVVYDSLRFTLVNAVTGTYQFDTMEFFPLDGRGWGTEPSVATGWMDAASAAANTHNFSFAMEMHSTFTHRDGLQYDFASDDDMWVFINGRLAMDLGGVHGRMAGKVVLDTIAGLDNGVHYAYDVFYCERTVSSASVLLTWSVSICCVPSEDLAIVVAPDTATIGQGDSLLIAASVSNRYTGAPRPDWAAAAMWRLEGDIVDGARLSTTTGDTVVLHTDSGGRTYRVIATACITEATPPRCEEDTALITVLPTSSVKNPPSTIQPPSQSPPDTDSDCGSGSGPAVVPLLFLRLASEVSRRKRRRAL
jgi:fibro-slime domain-containing protein